MKTENYKNMINELLNIDIGVYPEKIIGGDNPYKRRTKFMEGWNAVIKKYALEEIKIVKKYKKFGFKDDKKIKGDG